jgi:copper(I)-binding protein
MPCLRSAAFAAHLSHFVAAGCFVLSAFALPAVAADYRLQSVRIEDAYARPTPPGARTGGAYFTVENQGGQADRLLRVSSPAAKSAEIHKMTMDGNIMRMRSVPSLDIPAGAKVTLRPGGYHVMLVGLERPLVAGQHVPLTLTFEKAGTIDVHADVEAAPAGAQAHAR